jgi:hypothetical protein
MGFLADVQEGDDPDDWPTFEDADRQLMLRETHSYATLLEGFLKEVLMDNDFNANSGRIHLSEYVDKTLEAYLVLTYVNSYNVWREECRRNMPLEEEEEEPQLMQGPAAKKKWTAEGRGSGKYQGWSKTGIDTYNALVDVIAKQRLNTRNKTILSNFEPNLRQTFADQQAALTGRRGNTGTRKRKAANSLSLGLESPTGFVLQGLPTTASTMMGV